MSLKFFMFKYSTFYKTLCIVVMATTSLLSFAQVDFNKTPDDDLGLMEDEFQEHFFEALKQKGIENYQRATEALQKCLDLDKSHAVVYFELGKNYNTLKNFGAAEDALKSAIALEPDNVWFLDELYEVYYQQNDINKAIKTIKQLVKYHPDYKEDLATLYIRQKQYKDALALLNELDKELGLSAAREDMRNTIYDATGKAEDRIEYLEQRIANDPNNEDHHLKLIYRYSQTGDHAKAYLAAQNLLKTLPQSKLVHLALYKFYLDENKVSDAIHSVKTTLTSPEINANAKLKVLQDFVSFVAKNPEYESDLMDITSLIDDAKDAKTQYDLGHYYLKAGDKAKALFNFREALKQKPNDFKLIIDILQLQLDINDFDAAAAESGRALELYPAQPLLYFINGKALNHLKNPKKAIEQLELGLEFLIDDKNMQADFYNELSKAHQQLNNINDSETFAKKAAILKAQQ